MKFKHFFISLLLLLVAITAGAQMPTQTIPADTAFRVGRLSNGLTYYIRYNNWPENRANFYIAQKVGSIQEMKTNVDWLISLSIWPLTGLTTSKATTL